MHDDGADHALFIFNLHTKTLFLYSIYISYNQLVGLNPLFARIKEFPSYWEG
jgi:hypothetical protein